MNETERISRAIAREHARLDQLYVDIESTKTRITELEMRLRGNSATQFSKENDIDLLNPIHESNKAKIAIFRFLFRGREDVFARFWQNERTGKSGYSPACMNEWHRTLCAKLGIHSYTLH